MLILANAPELGNLLGVEEFEFAVGAAIPLDDVAIPLILQQFEKELPQRDIAVEA